MNNEPVAWINLERWMDTSSYLEDCVADMKLESAGIVIPLYTHPVKEQDEPNWKEMYWQMHELNHKHWSELKSHPAGLTDEEIHNLMDEIAILVHGDIKRAMYRMARKVESILNE